MVRLSRNSILSAAACALAVVALATLVACQGSTGASSATSTTAGGLPPIVVPTLPAQIPAYGAVDPATGLHMTGRPVVIDLATYRLKVDGAVAHPLSLSYDDLRRLPKVTATPTLVCSGAFTDVTTWSGAPLHLILEMAAVNPGANEIMLKGADGYTAYLSATDALAPQNFLAYQWKDQPLPVLDGFPLRAVFPDEPGSRWVKWLLEIVVL